MPPPKPSRLYFPGLAGIYESLWTWIEVLLRVVAGLNLLTHGLPKIGIGGGGSLAGTGKFLESLGYYPGVFWAAVIILLETVGGVLLAVGLYTRLVAALLTIEFINIVYWDYVRGGWGRAELAVLWLAIILYFLIRGGGEKSVDARMNKEF